MNSRQCEQKVGWRKNVAMNLWPFTWWTRLLIAPRRRFRNGWSLLFAWRLIIWFCWLVSTNATWLTLTEVFCWTSVVLTLWPSQINFHMQLSRRLQVYPEVRLFLLITCYQILKCYCGIGIKDIIDWCFMEHGDAQRIGVFHFVNQRLIPDWIECFLFDAGTICLKEGNT